MVGEKEKRQNRANRYISFRVETQSNTNVCPQLCFSPFTGVRNEIQQSNFSLT